MSVFDIKTAFLAPSRYFERVLSREIAESCPKEDGKKYVVRVAFSNTFDYKGKEYHTNALDTNKACGFTAQIQQGAFKDYPSKLGNSPYFSIDKIYTLRGWIEVDWDRTKQISIFYNVLGNVIRDSKTAVAMVLL